MRRITILVASLLCYVGLAEAQQAIFLVRHGDTVRQQATPPSRWRIPGNGGPWRWQQCSRKAVLP